MKDVLQVAGAVAGLGGLALGVFLLLFKELLGRLIFPKLPVREAVQIIVKFMNGCFIVTIVGMLVWLASLWAPGNAKGAGTKADALGKVEGGATPTSGRSGPDGAPTERSDKGGQVAGGAGSTVIQKADGTRAPVTQINADGGGKVFNNVNQDPPGRGKSAPEGSDESVDRPQKECGGRQEGAAEDGNELAIGLVAAAIGDSSVGEAANDEPVTKGQKADDRQSAANNTADVTQISSRGDGLVINRSALSLITVNLASRQANTPIGGSPAQFELPNSNRESLEKLLAEKRGKKDLSDEERWSCAVAAALLELSGRKVSDLDRWINQAVLDRINAQMAKDLAGSEAVLRRLKNESTVMLLAGDMAFGARDWSAAIDDYDRYVTVGEKSVLANDPDEQKELLVVARKKLGLTYLERAESKESQARLAEADGRAEAANRLREEAKVDRGNALIQFTKLSRSITGTSLDIVPDANRKPDKWLPHIKAGIAAAEVRNEGAFTYLFLHDESSSFSFIRLVNEEAPEKVCLQWKWKLDIMPPGYRNEADKLSVNHPLSVVVALLQPDTNQIVALHYVWDPLEPRGKTWIDPNSERITIPPLSFKTVYLHKVVADSRDPLHKWIDCKVDVAADYRSFFHEEPPAIRAILVQTNCQFGEPGRKRVAEGSIGGLRFVAKMDGKCP